MLGLLAKYFWALTSSICLYIKEVRLLSILHMYKSTGDAICNVHLGPGTQFLLHINVFEFSPKCKMPSFQVEPRTGFQGCQMVYFWTKNPNLGTFWTALQWKMMVYFMDTWSILRSFVILYGHLVQFMVIWYIFPILVISTEKSGNPAGSDWRTRWQPVLAWNDRPRDKGCQCRAVAKNGFSKMQKYGSTFWCRITSCPQNAQMSKNYWRCRLLGLYPDRILMLTIWILTFYILDFS
jgi:hypothetical protein